MNIASARSSLVLLKSVPPISKPRGRILLGAGVVASFAAAAMLG